MARRFTAEPGVPVPGPAQPHGCRLVRCPGAAGVRPSPTGAGAALTAAAARSARTCANLPPGEVVVCPGPRGRGTAHPGTRPSRAGPGAGACRPGRIGAMVGPRRALSHGCQYAPSPLTHGGFHDRGKFAAHSTHSKTTRVLGVPGGLACHSWGFVLSAGPGMVMPAVAAYRCRSCRVARLAVRAGMAMSCRASRSLVCLMAVLRVAGWTPSR